MQSQMIGRSHAYACIAGSYHHPVYITLQFLFFLLCFWGVVGWFRGSGGKAWGPDAGCFAEYNGITGSSLLPPPSKEHWSIALITLLMVGDPLLVRIGMLRESHPLFVEIILIHVIIQYFRFRL